MIELQQVTKIFDSPVRAVDNVSFTVEEGELFGLIGTSGCGKTTTLKMINRIVEPSSGMILINKKPVDVQPPEQLRRNIGYVIQNVGLFPHYTIRENISIVPKLLNWDQQKIDRRCDELLNLVGLDSSGYAGRMPEALSGGQQQRVGFARALAADPEVILMDEPFGALDPITKEGIQSEFKKLLKEINKTILLVTHDVSEAFNLCDRVALMDRGSIRQIGTPKELLLNPANEFVSSFFDVHRLELEMQTITLQDVLTVEDGTAHAEPNDSLAVKLTDTVADVLNRHEISDTSDDLLSIRDSDGRIVAYLRADDLLSGFNKVRKKIREESHG